MSSEQKKIASSLSSSFLRNLWPIEKKELGKFIPMAALMFCVLFNQNVLRILKDSILISEISAEITSFIKVYCVTPFAAFFVIVYAKLINHSSYERIFYYLTAFFTTFFVLFGFVIYPNIDYYHMDPQKLEALMLSYPHFKWYIAIIANWSYVVFYTLSEVWPNIFYVLLFWQLANEITTTSEAKRFYTYFSLFGNTSVIFVGIVLMNLASGNSSLRFLFTVSDDKIFLIMMSISLVAICSVLSCLIVRYVTRNVMNNPNFYIRKVPAPNEKAKLGLIESFKYIARSRYLWLMLICSASFGLSMNLVEAVWKSKIKELYPSVTEYAAYNSLYIMWTGITITALTLVGGNIMRNRNWFVAAVISPIIILVTGSMFFSLVVFRDSIISLFEGAILVSPLALAVTMGAVQNILSKGSKYSIGDASREMLYIPLDNELRTKGKAAVDIISPKLGKSSSGLVISLIFTLFPTANYDSISPLLMVIFIVVCVSWIYAVRKIYYEYLKIVE